MHLTTFPLLVLFVIFFGAAALLGFFILLQKGKGDGLAGLLGGGGASDGMGTPEAQKELSRWTAYLASFFFGVCLVLTFLSSRCGGPTALVGDNPADLPVEGGNIEAEFTSPEAQASGEAAASPEFSVPETPASAEDIAAPATPEIMAPPAEAAAPAAPATPEIMAPPAEAAAPEAPALPDAIPASAETVTAAPASAL